MIHRLNVMRIAIVALSAITVAGCGGGSGDAGNAQNELVAAPASKYTPTPSRIAPPSKAFSQFERLQAGKFHSTEQFTVFTPGAIPGSVDSIQYQYVYSDGRFDKLRSFNFDVTLKIIKFGSAEQATGFLDGIRAKAIPIADAGKVKLPTCSGEKRDSDSFIGPDKIVKTVPNPRGGEITVFEPGDFNMYDCTRGHNPEESAAWTEGEYYFSTTASKMATKADDSPTGRSVELALDYLAALGPR